MSGGHFNHMQHQIDNLADEIEVIINANGSGQTDDYGDLIDHDLPKDILNQFSDGVKVLRKAFVYAHRIDYLLSNDDSPECFRKRLAEDLHGLEDESLQSPATSIAEQLRLAELRGALKAKHAYGAAHHAVDAMINSLGTSEEIMAIEEQIK